MIKPMDIIFIGAILVIIGGIVGAVGTRMQNKASSAKSDRQIDKIDTLTEENRVQGKNLFKLSEQNSELSLTVGSLSKQNQILMRELAEARNDVLKSRQEAIDNTFGSNGAVFVVGENNGLLFNESLLPVYDASIFVTNYDELLKCPLKKDHFGLLAVNGACYNAAR